MTCKAGMIATVVSSTPKLVEAWQKVKNFGVGSTVEVFKVEGHEAVVIFRSGNRQDKVKVPVMCLSCYSGKDVPSGAVWDGTNKDLRPLPEEDGEDLAVPAAGISAEVAEAEMSGRRICPTCGAAVSEVDSMCNVCGGMMPPPADRFALGELEADGQEGSISCPSCGATSGCS